MTGQITEDDKSEQPFRVELKNGKLSWFKEAWLEDGRTPYDMRFPPQTWMILVDVIGIDYC